MQHPAKHSLTHMILACFLLISAGIFAQTNPTAQSVPYSQNFSGLAYASTTYPAGWQGWKISSAASTSYVTASPTGDQALVASSGASNTAGGLHNYNGKIGMLSSGTVNPAMALALVTTGLSNIHVTYDIMVIRNPYDGTANTRINEATLQYRIGTTGTFTTLTGMEYTSGTTLQTGSGVTTPQNPQTKTLTLPAACDNQAVVQIRWVMKDVSGAGSRPSFAIDNISIEQDNDGDGSVASLDCNDANATIYPGAPESCNGVDDNCNGTIDEGAYGTFYADADGDIYGDPASSTLACSAPLGYVGNNLDCNDADPAINPSASEICNAIDDDCDGLSDDADPSVTGQPVWFIDNDGDGFGDVTTTILACNLPAGYSADPSDCNDADVNVNIIATEICNGFDDNCDGLADDDDPGITGQPTWYADADGDGYGDMAITAVACIAPVGFVADNTDCDDTDNGTHPGVIDLCNGIDNDCDGNIDDDALFTAYYLDNDGDGFGDMLAAPTTFCYVPAPIYVTDNTDCNDGDAAIHPGAIEICNGLDENCEGGADDGLTFTTYYFDADGDGFGDNAVSTSTCDGTPVGYVSDNSDCDDALILYADADGDGYGSGAPAACGVTDNTDCNDAENTIHPDATEICNGLDDNCNGTNDDGVIFTTYYLDADGDGYGDPFATAVTCDGPPTFLWILDNTDCDDAAAAAHPGGVEVCDGLDNDCDGEFDEGTVTATISPSGSVSTCKGVPVVLQANTGAGYTYQWFKNGNNIIGATASTFITTKPAYYQVQVNIPEGCFALSAVTTVTTLPAPNANISAPTGTSLCTTVKLKASYDATYTWQWKKDGTPITGASSYQYFPTIAGNYTCTITNNVGCSRTSAAIAVTACKEGDITENTASEIFTIYPNPANDAFTVDMEIVSDAHSAQLQIFNLTGEEIFNTVTNVLNGTVHADVQLNNNIPSGLYLVKVIVAEKEYTQQVVVAK